MPYAVNGKVHIYYEVEGEGPPLVLTHAISGSLEMWKRRGYVDALKNDYKLVLIDFRGHGKSDKPSESSAYAPDIFEKNANDVIAVLDALNISKAHYYGFSVGARTGYQLAVYHPDRFVSFILGCFPPFEIPEEVIAGYRRTGEIIRLALTDIDAAVAKREEYLGRILSDEEKQNIVAMVERLNTDSGLMAVLAMSEIDFGKSLKVEDVAAISHPCLIYCGDSDGFYDGVKKASETIPHSTWVSLPEYDHDAAFVNRDTILPHVKEFLAKVTE